MRLSELVARHGGDNDPILMIEDEDGIPRPVVDTDLGVLVDVAGNGSLYVLLETRGEYDEDGYDFADASDGGIL